MYSQLHPHLAKAYSADRPSGRQAKGPSPPGRLRGSAAYALAGAARWLDADRAREAAAH